MNQVPLAWLAAIAAVAALGLGFWLAGRWWPASRERSAGPTTAAPSSLPAHWPLAPRPVFSAAERRLYRRLREALPKHVVLVKLPLLRLCQPTDTGRRRYWYRLLGGHHVAFAVSNSSGRVLVAIDIEPRDADAADHDRALRLKRSVFDACGIRYVSVPPEPLPSVPELRSLLPEGEGAAAKAPPPPVAAAAVVPPVPPVPPEIVAEPGPRPPPARVVEPDPTLFLDSFFAPDEPPAKTPSTLTTSPSRPQPPDDDDDHFGGVVVDTPPRRPDRSR